MLSLNVCYCNLNLDIMPPWNGVAYMLEQVPHSDIYENSHID
jgi:hypothetical protein